MPIDKIPYKNPYYSQLIELDEDPENYSLFGKVICQYCNEEIKLDPELEVLEQVSINCHHQLMCYDCHMKHDGICHRMYSYACLYCIIDGMSINEYWDNVNDIITYKHNMYWLGVLDVVEHGKGYKEFNKDKVSNETSKTDRTNDGTIRIMYYQGVQLASQLLEVSENTPTYDLIREKLRKNAREWTHSHKHKYYNP